MRDGIKEAVLEDWIDNENFTTAEKIVCITRIFSISWKANDTARYAKLRKEHELGFKSTQNIR